MSNLKGATKLGIFTFLFVAMLLAVALLNNNSQSLPVNVTKYNISNSTFATLNGSVSLANSTVLEANGTFLFNITLNNTFTAFGTTANVNNNVSQINFTFSNITGSTNWAIINGSNRTQLPADNVNFLFERTAVDGRINVTWNATATNKVGLLQNSSGGTGMNNTAWFAFNFTVPNATGVYVVNISTINNSVATADLSYNKTNFTFYVVDRTAPASFALLGVPENNTNNNTVDVEYTYIESGFGGTTGGCGAYVGFNTTNNNNISQTILTANNTIRSTTPDGSIRCKTSFILADADDGSFNVTLNSTDQSLNAPNEANRTFTFWRDKSAPNATLIVQQGSTNVDGTVISGSSTIKLSCNSADGQSGITSQSLTVKDPNGASKNYNCGDSFSPDLIKDDKNAYTITYTATNGASLTSSVVAHLGTRYSTGTITPPSQSTPVASPEVLSAKTLTVSGNVTTAKPVEIPVPADTKTVLKKLTVTVSKDVPQELSSVKLTELKQIPKTDEKGQTLTSLPSASQPVISVVQVEPTPNFSAAVKEAQLEFSLTDDQMTASNVTDPKDVRLLRFNNGWTELVTEYLGRDNTTGTQNFRATTPGFSVFVVTTKSVALATSPTPAPPATTPVPSATPKPSATATPAPPSTGLPNTVLYGIIAVVIIIVIAVVGLTMKKKK